MSIDRVRLLHKEKEINIPVHGAITITLMAKYFIDNKYFKRLSELKQLGVCDYIFPGATHTRFEHSLGTYYLADRLLKRIKEESDNNKMMEWLGQIPELKSHYEMKESQLGLNSWIIELIKIAALCHDLGHGPFSHLFDDIFIKNSYLKDHPLATHEQRSCMLLERIVIESDILCELITKDDIKFIQSLIDPDKKLVGFVYQIVSNNLNGLDVDKFDYLGRDSLRTGVKSGFDFSRLVDSVLVIDNKIVYPEQAEYDIYNLFTTRHAMHRRVYGHKGVISAQYIITEIMTIVNKVLNIAESILDPNIFVDMTDSYIMDYMKFILQMRNNENNPFKGKLTEKDYAELDILKLRVQTHNLYVHIGTIISGNKLDVTNYYNDANHMIISSKVGFVSGNKTNPLDNIYVYKTKDFCIDKFNVKAYKINKNDITHIVPEAYQEYVTMVYRRDRDVNGIKEDKELFHKLKKSSL
jgi:HD superfamily phosphohydrolase